VVTTGSDSATRAIQVGADAPPPPPSGGSSLAEAIDINNNNRIDDNEVLQAMVFWITGTPVPGSGGRTISDDEIRALVQMWIRGDEVSSASAGPASHGLKAGHAALTVNGSRALLTLPDQGVAQLRLQVFDLEGRRVLDETGQGNQLSVSLTSATGARLANGVYLYVVGALGADGQWQRSGVKKFYVLN